MRFISSVRIAEQKSSESIPFRICGKERVVTTIAVYLREKADGVHNLLRESIEMQTPRTRHEHGADRLIQIPPNYTTSRPRFIDAGQAELPTGRPYATGR